MSAFQSITAWVKRYSITIALVTLMIIGAFQLYSLLYTSPFKVVDPGNPRFDPMKYAFNDYKDQSEDRVEALKRVFPQNSSLERAKAIMASNSCHYNERSSEKNTVRFSCESFVRYPLGYAPVLFHFGDDGQLIDYFSTDMRGIHTGLFHGELIEQFKNRGTIP